MPRDKPTGRAADSVLGQRRRSAPCLSREASAAAAWPAAIATPARPEVLSARVAWLPGPREDDGADPLVRAWSCSRSLATGLPAAAYHRRAVSDDRSGAGNRKSVLLPPKVSEENQRPCCLGLCSLQAGPSSVGDTPVSSCPDESMQMLKGARYYRCDGASSTCSPFGRRLES